MKEVRKRNRRLMVTAVMAVLLVLVLPFMIGGLQARAGDTHTVSFYLEYGSVNGDGGPIVTAVTNGSEFGDYFPADPVRTGFVFSGWYTEPFSGGERVSAGDTVNLDGDIVLYARWSLRELFTVEFDLQSGEGLAPSQTVSAGGEVILPQSPDIYRIWHTFGGWFTGAGGTGTEVRPGMSWPVADGLRLYAKWDEIAEAKDLLTYTIPTGLVYTGSLQGIGAVTAAPGVVGLGGIQIFYEGVSATVYPRSAVAPTNAGSYLVTADIAAGAVYGELLGVELGEYTIARAEYAPDVPESASSWVYSPTTTLGFWILTQPSEKGTWAWDSLTIIPEVNGSYTASFTLSATYAANFEVPVGSRTATVAVTVQKASGAEVSSPGLDEKTNNSITILAVTPPANDQQEVEYAISRNNTAPADDSAWQPGLTFSGLLGDTTYFIFARSASSRNFNAGFASAGLEVKTYPNPLEGTVTIDNMSPRIGDVLTASFSEHNNTGSLTFIWFIGTDSFVGASYTVRAADLDKTITVEARSSIETGGVTSNATAAVLRSVNLAVPVAPEVVAGSVTSTSVILVARTGYEYRYEGGDWQDSPEFEDLDSYTNYVFFQRIKETGDTEASVDSVGIQVRTEAGTLFGIVTVSNMNPRIGDVLTALFAGNTALVEFTWSAGGIEVGTGVEFTVGLAERDKVITVVATSVTPEITGSVDGPATAAVLRALNTIVPPAPVLASRSSTQVILFVETPGIYEWSNNGGLTWQYTGPVFTGLTPNTMYEFIQRVRQTEDREASAPSQVLFVSTNLTVLSGTAVISRMNPLIGDNLTAELMGSDNTGALSFAWFADGLPVGANAIFPVRAADYEKVITVVITSSNQSGSITSIATLPVDRRAAPYVPGAPEAAVDGITSDSITLAATAGYEYRLGSGEWTTDNVFSGLSPNVLYTFYQRIAATEEFYASEPSPGGEIRTVKMTVTAPPAPEAAVNGITDGSVTLVGDPVMEFTRTPEVESSWTANPVFSGLSPDTEYVFYQRLAETGTAFASAASAALSVRTLKIYTPAPPAPAVEVDGITSESVTLVFTEGLLYSKDGTNWQAGAVFEGLSVNTEYTFYQMIAETDTHAASAASLGLTVRTLRLENTDTPLDPELESLTATSVTLVSVAGYEYRYEGGEWQDSAVFTGLTPNEDYMFFQRIKETDTHFASVESDGLPVRTVEAVLSGTVVISNTDPRVGDILFGELAGVTGTGTLTLTWVVGGRRVTGTNYLVTEADLGLVITLEIRSDNESGMLSASTEAVLEFDPGITPPVLPPAPPAPTVAVGGVTDTSVTLVAVADFEYSIDDINWTRSNIFTGLISNTSYTFYQRSAPAGTYASEASPGRSVTTLRTTVIEAPTAPEVSVTEHDRIALVHEEGMEYSIDGGNTWQSSPVFEGLDAVTEYVFIRRTAETDREYASPVSGELRVTTVQNPRPETPTAPTVAERTHTSIELVHGEGMEYSIDNGATWQESPLFEGLETDEEYSFIRRLAATETTLASLASAPLVISTLRLPGAEVPDLNGEVLDVTRNSITVGVITPPVNGQVIEYAISRDGTAPPATGWQTGTVFTDLEAGVEYFVWARTRENNTHETGDAVVIASAATEEAGNPYVFIGAFGGAAVGLIAAGIAVVALRKKQRPKKGGSPDDLDGIV
jgi:uncharacterized repeat protein (TIGR02543 family)